MMLSLTPPACVHMENVDFCVLSVCDVSADLGEPGLHYHEHTKEDDDNGP